MLCTIYRTTFEMNHTRKISRAIESMQHGPFGEYEYYYDKPSHMLPLMKPYNFHFNKWQPIIFNFNPENPNHWSYFRKYACTGFQSLRNFEFINEISYDWMPKDAKTSLKTQYIVYKVIDENGNIVNTDDYIDAYFENLRKKREEQQAKWDTEKNPEFAYQHMFLRHPRTTNEKRQVLSPEDKAWLKENGYRVKERRRRKYLPTVYDDIFVDIPRCWKDRTKQDAQWKSKRKAKHKMLNGYPQQKPICIWVSIFY